MKLFLPIFLAAVASISAWAAPAAATDSLTTRQTVITRFLSDGSVRTDTIAGDLPVAIPDPSANHGILAKEAPAKRQRTKMSTVMIGAELSTSLDLSGADMSTFNADIIIGYRHKLIQTLGVSFGMHKSLGTRDSFIPIQLVFRSGLIPRQQLFFLHLAAGYSFNTISSSPMFGDLAASVGCGVNLVQKPGFPSKVVLAFGFRHFTEKHQVMASVSKPNVGFAQIAFGISM
ncbi:MAG: hypothetical protein K2H21_10205 [Muribaculaceae bacterium]|nr:hypothetical protein [Muribaculaceae bacterium]